MVNNNPRAVENMYMSCLLHQYYCKRAESTCVEMGSLWTRPVQSRPGWRYFFRRESNIHISKHPGHTLLGIGAGGATASYCVYLLHRPILTIFTNISSYFGVPQGLRDFAILSICVPAIFVISYFKQKYSDRLINIILVVRKTAYKKFLSICSDSGLRPICHNHITGTG
jgi:hypothetical protein